jgi:hypothetical protein
MSMAKYKKTFGTVPEKVIILSTEVHFDNKGIAEVTEEIANILEQIPGYALHVEEPKKTPNEDSGSEKDSSEDSNNTNDSNEEGNNESKDSGIEGGNEEDNNESKDSGIEGSNEADNNAGGNQSRKVVRKNPGIKRGV